jgi:hypothetical protein
MIVHSPGFTSAGTLCGSPGQSRVDSPSCEICRRIIGHAKGPHVGDYVSVPYFDGLKPTTVYGIVEQGGDKTFLVRWESDIRNRVRYEDLKGVKKIPLKDVDPHALERLNRYAKEGQS